MVNKTNYIFPKSIADKMSKVDVRLQLEAQMMSMVFILFGLLASAVYTIGFTDFSIWIKIIMGVNVVAGIFYMVSGLVTLYQQYRTFMEAKSFQEQLNTPITPVIVNDDVKKDERGLEDNGN